MPFALSKSKIGFIGTGNMANAICEGMVASKLVPSSNIYGSDVYEPSRQRFSKISPEIKIYEENAILVEECDILIIAVKPQYADEMLSKLDPKKAQEKVIVSIMAGKTIESIQKVLQCDPKKSKVVRVMPNTPLMVNAGASGIVGSEGTSPDEVDAIAKIFSCAGEVAILKNEKLLDPITALSGSGPGYVFAFIECLAEGAEKLGIPRDTAVRFAIQTVYGAGKLAHERYPEMTPGQLREMVTSKGGTTNAALEHLKENNFQGLIYGAMQACVKRAEQLSKI